MRKLILLAIVSTSLTACLATDGERALVCGAASGAALAAATNGDVLTGANRWRRGWRNLRRSHQYLPLIRQPPPFAAQTLQRPSGGIPRVAVFHFDAPPRRA